MVPIVNALLFVWLMIIILNTIANMWRRYLRSKNIRESGWPPPHLDADGDFKEEDD